MNLVIDTCFSYQTACEQNSTAMPVAQLAELLRRSSNRLPTSADGLTDAEAAPTVEQKQDKEAFLMRMVKGLSGQVRGSLLFALSSLTLFFLASFSFVLNEWSATTRSDEAIPSLLRRSRPFSTRFDMPE